ncbi:hypothetical protein BDR04DRAFT_149098 [Suillus decipiens]|nr:hypothetical protein BDR04DRAFT_149098 [Suillus decipiens]
MSSASVHSTSDEEFLSHPLDLRQSLTFSGNEEELEDDQAGDYSARMEELLSDGDDEHDDAETDEDDGGFIYDGVDADLVTGDNYRDLLRDVLGPEDSYDESEEQEVVQALLQEKSGSSNDLPRDVPRVDIQLYGLLRRTGPSYNFQSHSYTQTSPDFAPLRRRAPLLPALDRLILKL